MKRTLTWILIVIFMSAGCASEKAWQDYHQSIDKQTEALIAFAKEQESRKAVARTNMMAHYTTGMNRAAITESPTDDVLLAFAWGVQVATPDKVNLPKLPHVEAPDKSSDLVRAWTPVMGMAVPFLYPLAYGWADSGNGASYTATDNAKINISSENAGSLNTAGNDQTLTVTDNRTQLENDCIECDGDGPNGAVNPLTGEAETLPEEGGETCEVTGGYLGADNKLYANPDFTCSCPSRSAGNC